MEEYTEDYILEDCDCKVEETGVVKVNGLVINTAELPGFLTEQVDSISSSSNAIAKAIDKAVELKEKANVLDEKVRLFGKRKAIEDLQDVVKELLESMDSHCDALISFQKNFEKLSKTSEVLLGLSLVNSAQRNMVIRTIQQKLENASKEKLTALAQQELRRVLNQLNAQQELENRVTSLKEKFSALNQQMKTLQADVKTQLDNQNTAIDGRLKKSKEQTDEAIKQAREGLKNQLDAQNAAIDGRLNESKKQTDGAIEKAKEDVKTQLKEQNRTLDAQLNENEGKFTSFRNDLETLLGQSVVFEDQLNKHNTAIEEQKQKCENYFELTTTALNEVTEKCDKLIKKSKGNGWRYFISALIGCGFASLAFYLLNYVL